MDALTNVLEVLRLEPVVMHYLHLRAPWGIALAATNGAAFHVVDEGQCWLRLPDQTEPIVLRRGDLIVLSNTAHYELLDNPRTAAVPLQNLLAYRSEDGRVEPPGSANGEVATLICGEFRTDQNAISPLFSMLPPFIHIQAQEGRSVEWLAAPLEQIAFESRHDYPGKATVVSRLMDILFIMVIRYWIVHQGFEHSGWFGALYHPQIGEVLGHIHREPQIKWTVESLAATVHMSRSALANQFTALVGESPMQYMTRWRMQLAAQRLRENRQEKIDVIAERLGYASPYSFSKAFKRLLGVSPTEYRNRYQGENSDTSTSAP
ncbi:MAG: helix-turn-helix domain-containing protein [Chloroflexi bacterium]|nr:helix-turn-helix domain-containing protein [Chloroflexota bacterium]